MNLINDNVNKNITNKNGYIYVFRSGFTDSLIPYYEIRRTVNPNNLISRYQTTHPDAKILVFHFHDMFKGEKGIQILLEKFKYSLYQQGEKFVADIGQIINAILFVQKDINRDDNIMDLELDWEYDFVKYNKYIK